MTGLALTGAALLGILVADVTEVLLFFVLGVVAACVGAGFREKASG